MATVQEVVQSKLNRYNIELDAVEFEVLLLSAGLTGSNIYDLSMEISIKKALVMLIPELLLRPDITEGGYSEKFDKTAIITFYSHLCKELGLPDKINPQPRIRNKTNRW